MIKIKWYYILGLIISSLLFAGCDRNIQIVNYHQTGMISASHSVGQTFYSGRNNVSSVKVLFYNPANLHPEDPNFIKEVTINFHLREIGQTFDLRQGEMTINAQKEDLDITHRFNFEPIQDAKNQYYYFFLTSDTPTNLVGLDCFWGETVNDRSGGIRSENNQSKEGVMVFDLGYDDTFTDVWQNIISNIFRDKPFVIFYFVILLANILLIVYYCLKFQNIQRHPEH